MASSTNRIAQKLLMNRIVAQLADMTELEQLKAMNAEKAAEDGPPATQAVRLGERDRHIARSGAFIEAARLILQKMGN